MKTLKVLFFAIALFFISSANAQVGEAEVDKALQAKLDELGFKYEIRNNGDFKLVFKLENERTQIVNVRSKTYTYNGMQVREIYAPAKKTEEKSGFTQNELFMLLERNNTYKIGAWQINGGKSPFILEFGIRASANATKESLSELLQLAGKVADQVEEELTSKDDF